MIADSALLGKILPHHLERKAILYVRQSSAHQVLHNRESSALQYAMRGRLAELYHFVEDEPDRFLHATVGILLAAVSRLHEADRRGDDEFAPPRLLVSSRQGALPEKIELILVQTPLQTQQEAVVAMSWRIDRLLIDQHGIDDAAHLDQLLPVAAVASEARDLARRDRTDLEKAEAIRRMVSDNIPTSRHHGAPKHGDALLAGLVRCRRCGRKLTLRYSGTQHNIPRYSCSRGWLDNGEPRCIAFGGLRVDDAIEAELLRVVEPGAIAAAIAAEAEAGQRRDQARHALVRELEAARYVSDRALPPIRCRRSREPPRRQRAGSALEQGPDARRRGGSEDRRP